MQRAFRTFIGVDLGGGKGKTTAVARLRLGSPPGPAAAPAEIIVEELGPPGLSRPWYDEQLVDYLRRYVDGAVLAIDAPLTLTACVRCVLPSCPGQSRCEVPTIAWFRQRAGQAASLPASAGLAAGPGLRTSPPVKPRYTPYTQRATEVVLHEDFGILPRETLGQGMGPLTARMAYLRRALAGDYRLNDNLLEVYPKATLTQLFPDAPPAKSAPNPPRGIRYLNGNGQLVSLHGTQTPSRARSEVAQFYKRSGSSQEKRERVLSSLPGLRFAPGQWREFATGSDHQFDALICAYTAYLWARDGWELPSGPVFAEDGWIWFPPDAQPPR